MALFIAQTEQDAVLTDIFTAGNYVALITTAPTAIDGTTLVEVSGGSYARQAIGSSGTKSTSGSGTTAVRQASNAADYDFGTASADWGTIVGVAVYSASTAGNLLAYGDLTASKTVNNGDSFTIATGDFTVKA